MSGLYQRALAYIRSQNDAPAAEESPFAGGREITAEEREKVLTQINEIIARNRIQVTPETLRFTPKKGGGILPLVINAAAAIVLIGGIVSAVFLFRRQEQTIVTTPATLETAEGRLLQTLREESRRELSQKQQEIDNIQGRVEAINREKTQLLVESDARMQERERELREVLSRELEAERSRLQGAGLSDDRIAARLEALADEKRQSLETELAAFRSGLEAEFEQRKATLDGLIGEYEANLGRAQQESARLQQESAARQSEMEASFREQETALQGDRARALEQLEELRKQQEKEQLIRDQFLSFYSKTRDSLASRRFPEALATLAEFRNYLDQPSVSSLPGIRKRRPVELFLIGSLEQLVTQQRDSAGTETASLIASANLISRVSEMVDRADRVFQDGEYLQARQLYLSALAEIPAVKVGYDRLQGIESVFARRRNEEVARIMAAAGGAYRQGDYETAVSGYARALTILQGQRGTVDEMIARIMEAGYRLRSTQLAGRQAEAGGPASGGDLRERLAAVEDAKQLLSRLEASQASTARLAAELETARGRVAELEASAAAAQRRQGEIETLRDEARQRTSELEDARRRIAELQSELDDARGRLGQLEALQQQRRSSASELEEIRRQYLAIRAQRTRGGSSPRAALITLLETKVLIQRVLISEPVRTRYPELYDRFEQYLEALLQEQQRDTQAAVLKDLESLLDSLIRTERGPKLTLTGYAGTPSEEPFLRLLAKLEVLMQ